MERFEEATPMEELGGSGSRSQVQVDSSPVSDLDSVLALAGQDLDEAVAILLGAKWLDNPAAGKGARILVDDPAQPALITSWGGRTRRLPEYHKSLDAVEPVVLQCVASLGAQEYVWALNEVMGNPMTTYPEYEDIVEFLTASPTHKCHAVLLAYARNEE